MAGHRSCRYTTYSRVHAVGVTMSRTSDESQTQSTEPGTTSSTTKRRKKSLPAFSPNGCPQVTSLGSRTRRKKAPGYVSESATLPFIDPLPEVSRPEEAVTFLRLMVRDQK